MNPVLVCGLGAVSPAGWGVETMRRALDAGAALPHQALDRPGWTRPLRFRPVPPPAHRLSFLTHPRLRRSSPITHYAAAAALEAVGRVRTEIPDVSLGVIVCLQSGCVQYSHRFYDEALKDPATASPLVFPETVFAAPASHIATVLGNAPLVYTVVGDPASFLQGVELGAAWLQSNRVQASLVIGAEEINWLRADALWHLDRQAIITGGAGAICLSLDPKMSLGVALDTITNVHTFTSRAPRARAARQMREELPSGGPDQLLCDGLGDSPAVDRPESAAWRDWAGQRLSPKRILGEGLMAAAAWQCVAACDTLASRRYTSALVSLVGCNQHAIGGRFSASATQRASL